MNRHSALLSFAILLTLVAPATLCAQTLARLAHEATPDLSHPTSNVKNAPAAHNVTLRESSLSRIAARTFFVDSNLERARMLSARALARDPQDGEALFIHMEVAAMQADDADEIRDAVALCQIGAGASGDLRVRLAAIRLRETAANTPAFRSAIPHLQALLANSPDNSGDLYEALLSAAMDGAPGLDPYAVSRAAGILTDWRMVGPLGLHPLLDQQPISPNDDLSHAAYLNRAVENFAFPDGKIVLPDYLSHRGIFYAATNFSVLTAGSWTVQSRTRGALEIYVDGRRVLRTDGGGLVSTRFDAVPGPHRILLKFAASGPPLRIAVNPATEPAREALPRKLSPQELTYLLAVKDYVAGEFATAAAQIANLPSTSDSVPLRYLLAQSRMRDYPTMSDTTTAWDKPPATAASESDAVRRWSQAVAEHPSCKILLGATRFYREHELLAAAQGAQQRLDGCAPESLDYAQSLSNDGDHAAAARSLQHLLAAAPLNRAARQMLVRELQLAGDDEGAQQAAAEWLRIAPNAENYHRLAARFSGDVAEQAATHGAAANQDFYQPYRRNAAVIGFQAAKLRSAADSLMLLDDHVAVVRPDGSVSLYVHTAQRALNQPGATRLSDVKLPAGARTLTLRIVHADGTISAVSGAAQISALSPGDTLDEEYVLNYAGDGGIPEHAEVFQFVFGSFNEQVLYSRFVVLMPAGRADRGVVIATGKAPQMTTGVRDGMVERVWEESPPADAGTDRLAIVRVVEQENGWSEPSSAEHRRRIETIHPGPRPEES